MTAPTADPVRLAAARRRLAACGVVVLHEDHLLIAVGKAAGVLSQPGPAGEPSLVEAIDAYRREAEGKSGPAFVGLVHRLDRNVSGAMVVGKSSKAASRLSEAFRRRVGTDKRYLAWVARAPTKDRATLKSVLVRDYVRRMTRAHDVADDEGVDGATPATLDYEVVARGPGGARLAIRLHTGQTHQIRAQLAREGCPLVGDPKYGGPEAPPRARCARPALHAEHLTIPHPVGGAALTFTAPVPDDLRRLDAAMGLVPPVE